MRSGFPVVPLGFFAKKFLSAAAEYGFQENYYYYSMHKGDSRFSVDPDMLEYSDFKAPLLDVTCYIFSKTWYTVLCPTDLPDVGADQLTFLLSKLCGFQESWVLLREDNIEAVTDSIIEAFRAFAMPFVGSCSTVE